MTRLMTAAALAALVAAPATAQEVKFGSVAAVTGPIAELIEPIVAGRELAAKHVNAQGGLLDGRTMNLIQADSQCDPKAAVDAGDKVVNVEQVVAVVGASCSGGTNSMVQAVTIPSGVVSISDSATAPSISELEDDDLVFRTAASDAYQGTALAELAWDEGFRNLAVTYANDDYNAGIAEVFVARFEELGGTITANQVHEPEKASYRSEVQTVSQGEPDGLALFAYYGGSGITIIRNALETGAFDKFLGADGMYDSAVLEQIGGENLAGRVWFTSAASDPENESYPRFAEAYTEETGFDPGAPYATQGYDAAFLLALAVEKAGAAERDKISEALRAVANPPGEVIRVGEWEKAKALIAEGEEINYEGASGSVDFDENGDVPGFYSVATVGEDGKYVLEYLR